MRNMHKYEELLPDEFEAERNRVPVAGCNCVLDQNWQATASAKAGVVESPDLAASGKQMARASHDHRVVQKLKLTKDQKVAVRLQARGALPSM